MKLEESNLLKKARLYEAEQQKKVNPESRPEFHVCVPVGWMNDPNGFSEFKGEKHLFFQYHPYSMNWGPMHWGHCKTNDFVRWEYLPVALAPDTKSDEKGCFSGSAVEKDGHHILLYTGVRPALPGEESGEYQEQCIAVGDGLNYKKLDCNPVIPYDKLPKGSDKHDFRDPKIWIEHEMFYCVVGSRNSDTSGQIAMFQSKDLNEWEFVQIIAQSKNQLGKMWECPDFFSLDGSQVLITSPQEMLESEEGFHPGNNTMCLIGEYPSPGARFERKALQSIDAGIDFYAPQTMLTVDGRRIMIAWMKNWDNEISPMEFGWNGMMTFPREIHIRDQQLIQTPVKEIENYYGASVQITGYLSNEKRSYPELAGRVMDLELEANLEKCEEFTMYLAEKDHLFTKVTFDSMKEQLTVDRGHSGVRKDCVHSRSVKVRTINHKLRLRVLMDRYSIELFVNDGEQAISTLLFTNQEATGISFEVRNGTAQLDVIKHELKF